MNIKGIATDISDPRDYKQLNEISEKTELSKEIATVERIQAELKMDLENSIIQIKRKLKVE